MIQVDPERFGVDFLNAPASGSVEDIAVHRKTMDTFVARGMRAQLKTGSLISGSRFVAIEFHPEAPLVTLDWSQSPVQIPTLPGSMESIEAGVAGVIKKLNQMPLAEIGTNLNQTVSNLDKTLVGAQGTLTNADVLLKNAGNFIAPDSMFDAQLNAMLQQVGGAAQAMRVLADYLERHPEAILKGKSGSAK
jgi:paraquat-inducible protein B